MPTIPDFHAALAELRASLLTEPARWPDEDLADIQYACREAAATASTIRQARATKGRR